MQRTGLECLCSCASFRSAFVAVRVQQVKQMAFAVRLEKRSGLLEADLAPE